jgi:hypothetical protein
MSSCQGQPQSINLLQNNSFQFELLNAPDVNFFITQAEIPGISLITTSQPTRYNGIPMPGDEVRYQDLNLGFHVDENLKNYFHLHQWIRELGHPVSLDELYEAENRVDNSDTKFLGTYKQGSIYSDGILHILTAGGKKVHYIKYYDCFPVGLSSISFDTSSTKIESISATVSLKYTYFDFFTKD